MLERIDIQEDHPDTPLQRASSAKYKTEIASIRRDSELHAVREWAAEHPDGTVADLIAEFEARGVAARGAATEAKAAHEALTR